MSTRPRITFDEKGFVMLANGWQKKVLDWSKKNKILKETIDIINNQKNIMTASYR